MSKPAPRDGSGAGRSALERPVGGVVVGRLVVLLLQLLAQLGREAVAEDRPARVVGLVLQAARKETVAGEADRLFVQAGAGDRGEVGPGTADERAGKGQATLVGLLQPAVASLRQGEPRVADHADGALQRLVRAVEHEDREVDADLTGGQA